MFFPDQLYTGTAGDLRGVAVARELRSLGWRTIIVPPWLGLNARRWAVRMEPKAVLFFQQSRHPLNKPSLFPGHAAVFDADDADILNDPEPVLECLRGSGAVIAGSEFLAEQFRLHHPNVTVVWTGTYVERPAVEAAPTIPVLVWAQSNPFDYPHEAKLMLDLWTRLAESRMTFRVRVFSSESDRVAEWLRPITERGIAHEVSPRLRYREFIQSLSAATVGLQPICTTFAYSQGKSFGKVLGYIAAGLPVIASNEVDHARFFRDRENGLLVETLEDWVAACKLLLGDPALRRRLADRAYEDLGTQLSTRAAARKIDEVLTAVWTKWQSAKAGRRRVEAEPTA